MSAFSDAVGANAAGALTAQRAIWDLKTNPAADGVLLAALLGSEGAAWRTNEPWLRGFLRELEKSITR